MDVTAPGGIMAMALIYLQTDDESAAEALAIPSTYFELDLVRPDFIMLRMLGRSLIMWSRIEPTHSWLTAQLPDIIKASHLCISSLNLPKSLQGRTERSLTVPILWDLLRAQAVMQFPFQ